MEVLEDNTPYSLRKIADDLGAIDPERLYSAADEVERLRNAILQAERRGAEREREECAKIADDTEITLEDGRRAIRMPGGIAAAIRARTTTATETVT